LSHQVEELNAERQKLAVRPPRQSPEVNERLRLDYEARLQSTRAELDGLRKELAAGEFRLGTIAKEIEQRVITRTQIEKDLLALRNEVANATEQTPLLLERLEIVRSAASSCSRPRLTCWRSSASGSPNRDPCVMPSWG